MASDKKHNHLFVSLEDIVHALIFVIFILHLLDVDGIFVVDFAVLSFSQVCIFVDLSDLVSLLALGFFLGFEALLVHWWAPIAHIPSSVFVEAEVALVRVDTS